RPEEKRFLKQNGFLAVRDFSSAFELAELRGLVGKVMADDALANKTTVRDLTGGTSMAVREIVSPSQLEPKLLQTRIFRRAMDITEAMFGQGAVLAYDHIIDKPARSMKETAWHQDSTYSSPLSLSARRLHWWIPLQDVHRDNGCMAYLPRSHKGPRLRHVPVGPGAHTVKVADTSFASRAAYCEIPAGGACLHLPRTLHYTGPNRSDAPRVAWIFQITLRSRLPKWV
ncbi:MAG: phytanoyl-CoA dioxygenase family protein, partial [Hyphomonas sp.]